MSFKIIIPARFGSSRLPGKPLLTINDRPMILHVYQQALLTGIGAENIVIATDNDEIYRVATDFGAQVVMTEKGHESGTDRLAEVVAKLNWNDADIVVNVQGDEPMIPTALIVQTAQLLEGDLSAGISTLGCPIHNLQDALNPNVVKIVCDQNMHAMYFSRAAIPFDRDGEIELSKDKAAIINTPYLRHIGMYGYRVETLKQITSLPMAAIEKIEKLEQLRALYHGIKIRVGVLEHTPVHGVDTKEDLERVRRAFNATL
jgi:3-deoxy-manno-octulosonate cytidylyltransferase (CMP-KDO synthetase)